MDVSELKKFDIPEEFIKKFREEKIESLYQPQVEAIKKGVIDKSFVVAIPTAGGKTFLATLAIIDNLVKRQKKAIYIVPLVALANEKYQYYKKLFNDKLKVAISVGDLDSSDPWLADYDLIISTTEKLDSLIRHGARWINEIGLIVVDEIHLLNDPSRGPTLEILLTQLKEILKNVQILSLSATIKNVKELSKWLDSNFVTSDFRPIKLYEGITYDSKIHFLEKNGYELTNLETEAAILENTLRIGKQILYFVSSRKNAESLAEKLGKTAKLFLKRNEEYELSKLSGQIENVLEVPTRQCKKIAAYVRRGVAFHHAGLLGKQKRLIEENFRIGLIKSIVATPTLALGVNLPAFRVTIRDAKRYTPGIGSTYIPVLEYKQFVGRAGRPTYDSFGESILIAKSEEDAHDLTEHFINGQPEKIYSKLSLEPVLRMHTLALVASEFTRSQEKLLEFFSKTFYAHQYKDIEEIKEKILFILGKLEEWEFLVREEGRLEATRLGKRVSQLYIDPLTANYLITCLNEASKKETESISFLQSICNTIEMRPLLNISAGEFSELNQLVGEKERFFLQTVPSEYDFEFENFIRSLKTAVMFQEWLDEATEDKILTKFRVAPGELRNRLKNADWLIYSMQELALLMGLKELLKDIRKLRVRMMYGIKEELIPLVRLEGIGRVRSRKLYDGGLKSLDDLRKVPMEVLTRLIGVTIAKSIKNQLEGKKELKKKEIFQSNLTRF